MVENADKPMLAVPGDPSVRIRYRVRFQKRDLLRWISHRDLARLWERLIRRAELKLSMTEGFHPKPRVGFPSALALGVEGRDEVVELDLSEELAAAELFQRLHADQQPGLVISSVARLPEQFGKAKLLNSLYSFTIPDAIDRETLQSSIDEFLALGSVTVQRKNKPLTVQVSEQVLRLELEDDLLWLNLAASDAASLRPTDVLDLIDASSWIELGTLIVREKVVLAKEIMPGPEIDMVFATSESNSSELSSASCDQVAHEAAETIHKPQPAASSQESCETPAGSAPQKGEL